MRSAAPDRRPACARCSHCSRSRHVLPLPFRPQRPRPSAPARASAGSSIGSGGGAAGAAGRTPRTNTLRLIDLPATAADPRQLAGRGARRLESPTSATARAAPRIRRAVRLLRSLACCLRLLRLPPAPASGKPRLALSEVVAEVARHHDANRAARAHQRQRAVKPGAPSQKARRKRDAVGNRL